MTQALLPLYNGQPLILILGTFPSPLSRGKGEYYGNPQNQFWRIIFDVYNLPFNNPSYDEKKAVIFKNGIALWDVIESCEIEGAADSAIRNPVYNLQLPLFVTEHKIATIMFNGQKSHNIYRQKIGAVAAKILPSTSPANARLRYEEKLRLWAEALK